MARRPFGGGGGDYVEIVDSTGVIHADTVVSCQMFNGATAGTQIVDLQDQFGNSISEVATDVYGFVPPFFGPNDGTTQLWCDSGGTVRTRMDSTDGAARLLALESISGATPLTDVTATIVTADGALVIGKHNPVSTVFGNRSMTLASASSAGQLVSVEKSTADASTVTITTNLRGSSGSTIALVGYRETLMFLSKDDGSWWPIAGHITKAFMDATYAALASVTQTATGSVISSTLTGELVPRVTLRGDGSVIVADAPMTVSTASFVGTTVTLVLTAAHSYAPNDAIAVAGIVGITNVAGNFTCITGTTGSTVVFTASSTPVGTYASGGKVQRTMGGHGISSEGQFNVVLTSTTNNGISVRGIVGGTGQLFQAFDHNSAPVFAIPQFGGATMFGDSFRVMPPGNVTTPVVKLRADGTIQMAQGDAAGGAGVIAIGNATTLPGGGSFPDGSHSLDGSATAPGAVLYANLGRLEMLNQFGIKDEIGGNTLRRRINVYKDVAAATISTVGSPAYTLDTSSGSQTSADGSVSPAAALVTLTTGTTSGNTAGVLPANYTQLKPAWQPMWWARIITDPTAITSLRYWFGLFSADPSGSATPSSHILAFRYDTGADGTAFWRVVTNNATTATVAVTTVAIAAATQYDLRIVGNNPNNSYVFIINGVIAATATATLPTFSQNMAPALRATALSAAGRAFSFSRMELTHIG